MNQKKYEQRNKQDEESIERLNKQLDKIKNIRKNMEIKLYWEEYYF